MRAPYLSPGDARIVRFSRTDSTDCVQARNVTFLNGFGNEGSDFHLAQSQVSTKIIDERDFFLCDDLIGEHQVNHVLQPVFAHPRTNVQNLRHGFLENGHHVSLRNLDQIEL